MASFTQQQFLDLIIPQALIVAGITNFKVPSLLIAQACLESGWNKSSLAYKYNNLLGRKYSTNNVITDTYVTLKTQEYQNGGYITIYSKFCIYETIADCFRDYIWLLHNAKLSGKLRYQRVLDSKDYLEATLNIKLCGYATSLTYTQSLRTIIEKYKLNQYDNL